jgi:hypothetical protein
MKGVTVTQQIVQRATAKGRGAVFTPSDFLDLGSRAAVDQALSRIARAGRLRRVARGLYDYPRIDPQLGPLTPSTDAVAQALARETGSLVQVAGAQAANMLGVSLQVPAQTTYLTDGPPRTVQIGRRVIRLKHASPKNLVAAGTNAGTVVQALRYVGQAAAPTLIAAARSKMSKQDRDQLLHGATYASAWMRPVLRKLAEVP